MAARSRVRFIDRDLGWGRLRREIERARRKPHAAVGIFGAAAQADHGGLANVQVAAAHEFGATIRHPGGTAYIIREGKPVFVSNATAAALGWDLPRTKPHDIHVPERSFIRDTVDLKTRLIARTARALAQGILRGTHDTRVALEKLGLFVEGEIKKRIARGIPPPLSPATIRKKTVNGKQGTTPLINTGQLRASVDSEVRNA